MRRTSGNYTKIDCGREAMGPLNESQRVRREERLVTGRVRGSFRVKSQVDIGTVCNSTVSEKRVTASMAASSLRK